MYSPPPHLSPPSEWTSYVSVADVDATCAIVEREGGTVQNQGADIPGVGRMRAFKDPDGASMWAFRSSKGDPEPSVPAVGEFCWETLIANDLQRAKAFYKAVFGWHAADSGMTVFSTDGTPATMIADFQQSDRMPAQWYPYVVVAELTKSLDIFRARGGRILQPGFTVPHVGTYAVATDAIGATIGLFEPVARE